MAVSEKLMTADELLALPDDNMRHELVKGVLITMSPAGVLHGVIAMTPGRILGNYVADKDLGIVLAAETGFVLETDPDTVRAPDVAFVVQARIPEEGPPEKYWPGAPDLAVEVVSPGDSADEVQAKVTDYLAAGTRLVWVVHPKTRTVTEYQSLHLARILTESDALEGGEVVPRFSLPVRDLFAG